MNDVIREYQGADCKVSFADEVEYQLQVGTEHANQWELRETSPSRQFIESCFQVTSEEECGPVRVIRVTRQFIMGCGAKTDG